MTHYILNLIEKIQYSYNLWNCLKIFSKKILINLGTQWVVRTEIQSKRTIIQGNPLNIPEIGQLTTKMHKHLNNLSIMRTNDKFKFPKFIFVLYFFLNKKVTCAGTPQSNSFPLNLHLNPYAFVALHYSHIVKGG